jgi:pimeloyl-ACP methyl ester carboxylesterase
MSSGQQRRRTCGGDGRQEREIRRVGRHVTIWQGTEDQHVPSFHVEWLADHLPQAELRTLDSEGHNSIVRHLPEIISALIANGRPAQS